ncbi:hypothetical protein, partial [uncultured Prevotella sp.]|uniref:hypothetical protein n=1 Tax=uncultured Prevotella sp. TaxID=159272 RepID=UPI0025EE97C0
LLFSFTFTGIQTEQNYYYEILLPHIVKFLIEHSTFLFKDFKIRFFVGGTHNESCHIKNNALSYDFPFGRTESFSKHKS